MRRKKDMQMNKKSTVLILLLAVSMISMIPVLSMTPVAAEVVTYPTAKAGVVDWYPTTGHTDYLTLAWNPEYLKLRISTPFITNTTIIVQGKDTYGQNIEATVLLNGTHAHPIILEPYFIFNDTHSGMPVAFAEITGIFQQNGTHNNRVSIRTEPEPFQEYLGEYHKTTNLWSPGTMALSHPGQKYLVGRGDGQIPHGIQDVPVEPSNPDPIKVAINWEDKDGDLFPDSAEIGGATVNTTLTIEGLDEHGNKLTTCVTIVNGNKLVEVVPSPLHTWSTICKISGGASDESYYIFTHPVDSRILFYYTLLIDHITIHPDCYDILANPTTRWNVSQVPHTTVWYYPGVTNITVALRDQDGNLIHAKDPILVNFYTSGGKIQPSCDVWIDTCHITATANLTADTNARTIKVTADANVPLCSYCPEMNLFAWTELTFDGVNSVGTLWTSIHKMMWGWNSWNGTAWFSTFTGPVPPKPVLPDWLGGPAKDGIKLDGPIYEVMIPLYVGCNLISSPVHPMLSTEYYCEAYPDGHQGIPMSLLFGNTSATTCIEAVWWYDAGAAGSWSHYVPGVDLGTTDYFTDGVGYWIYAEKPCTLEISGVFMDNAPFTPPLYTLTKNSWNLVGITSLTRISIKDYLESVNSGDPAYMSAAGPVWIYYAYAGAWFRDPSWGLDPGFAFWVYNKVPADLYIAP
jgi:hypothetical protein